MGSRGASSMGSRGISLSGLQNELITNGRISLNVDDYKGIPSDKVRDLIAQQDYEIVAGFNDKDELIYIHSDFLPDRVSYSLAMVRPAINATKGNIRDFHNHPMDKYTVQIFSPKDVEGYVDCATGGKLFAKKMGVSFNYNNGMERVNTYSVQTQNGSKFTLTYTGVKTNNRTKTENFASAYEKAFRTHTNFYRNPDKVTVSMIKWMQKNAPKYGFELTQADYVPYKQ